MQNARTLLSILKGEHSPRTDIVALNAAAAIYVAGKVASIHDGLDAARESLESGRALAKLRSFSEVASSMEEARQKALNVQVLHQRRLLPNVLISRSAELTTHLSAQLCRTENGKGAVALLDPGLLSRPNVLSVIVLDRIHTLLGNGIAHLEAPARNRISLSSSITSRPGTAIIAEYKPRSPSSPPLSVPPCPEFAAQAYSSSGIAGVSVLVEPNYFMGGPELFSFFRKRLNSPMLFKDFVVMKEQVALASSLGADAILLIAKALRAEALEGLVKLCIALDVEPLVEIHDEEDLAKLSSIRSFDSVDMIGVNCRDLGTMNTDMEVFARLRPSIPQDRLVVAESGIRTVHDLERTRSADAVLIGSMFMNAEDLEGQLKAVVEASGKVER